MALRIVYIDDTPRLRREAVYQPHIKLPSQPGRQAIDLSTQLRRLALLPGAAFSSGKGARADLCRRPDVAETAWAAPPVQPQSSRSPAVGMGRNPGEVRPYILAEVQHRV
jgi:hypothetical protein